MAPRRRRKKQGDESATVFMVVIALGALLFYDPGVVAVLVAGLMPSFAALMADQTQYKGTRLRTIFAFNMAGLLPFLMDVVYYNEGLGAAIDVFSNIYFWMVVFGVAGVGSLVLAIAPHIAAFLIQALAEDRLDRIAKEQKKLVGEWGEEVGMKDGRDNLF
ncbi:MAG: hypothetical protein KAI28_01275 [Sphingomonadales bacterium]|nr:hypothetical protein [Sphingomonadales bacterium]